MIPLYFSNENCEQDCNSTALRCDRTTSLTTFLRLFQLLKSYDNFVCSSFFIHHTLVRVKASIGVKKQSELENKARKIMLC